MSIRDWFNKATNKDASTSQTSGNIISGARAEDFAPTAPKINASHFGTEPASKFTKERVVSYFLSEGYKFSHDEDGDLLGIWDGHPFWFLFLSPNSDFLQVRGSWHRKVSHQNRHLMMHTMNDWNRDRIWPKAYIREDSDGTENSIYSETTFDFSEGVSDLQLHYSIDYALQTALQFFTHLNGVLPPENGEPEED